jgi:hypothetical protein
MTAIAERMMANRTATMRYLLQSLRTAVSSAADHGTVLVLRIMCDLASWLRMCPILWYAVRRKYAVKGHKREKPIDQLGAAK